MDITINSKSFPFLGLTEFLYEMDPDYDGGLKSIPLTMDLVKKYADNIPGTEIHFSEYLKAFLGTLLKGYNDSHFVNQNLGIADYDQDRLIFFSRPILACVDDEIQLVIGGNKEVDGTEYKSVLIPLVKSPTGFTFQGTKINLDIENVEVKDRDDLSKTVKLPILIFNVDVPNSDEEFIANIPVRLKKGITYNQFRTAWKSGNVANLLDYVGGFGGGIAASISFMFSKWFEADTFPRNGIVLKITHAELSDSVKDKKTLTSVIYQIDTSMFPAINVISSGGEPKHTKPEPLNQITALFCNVDHNAGEPMKKKNHTLPSAKNPWYLHIQGKGRSYREVPTHAIHTGMTCPTRIMKIYEAQQDPGYFSVKVKESRGTVPYAKTADESPIEDLILEEDKADLPFDTDDF
jgi:hypothetical protein